MITTLRNPGDSSVRIIARGNFSLDAGGVVNLLLALGAVTLGLAGLLAWQGYWPILAIAVLQIALVAWIYIRSWERTWVAEVIDIAPGRIHVMQQRHKRKRVTEIDAAWAVVEMKQPDVRWYGPRLHIRSGGTRIELGRFLTIEERHLLAEQLKSAIAKHSAF